MYGVRELASGKGIGCYLNVSGHVITRILRKMTNNILWLWLESRVESFIL